jgi:malate synthase
VSAQIPIKNDPKANEVAMNKVKADKIREVKAGHDGTWVFVRFFTSSFFLHETQYLLSFFASYSWVAHPALVKIAMDIFNENMLGPNQVSFPLSFASSVNGSWRFSRICLLQYHIRREDVNVKPEDLVSSDVPGKITKAGIVGNASAYVSSPYCFLRLFSGWFRPSLSRTDSALACQSLARSLR